MEPTQPIAGVCGSCGAAVRNREPYTLIEVVAWQRIGKRSTTYVDPKPTGRVLCRSCDPMSLPGQGNLLHDA